MKDKKSRLWSARVTPPQLCLFLPLTGARILHASDQPMGTSELSKHVTCVLSVMMYELNGSAAWNCLRPDVQKMGILIIHVIISILSNYNVTISLSVIMIINLGNQSPIRFTHFL